MARDVLGYTADNTRVWVGITEKVEGRLWVSDSSVRKCGKKRTYWQTFDVPAQTLFQVSGSTRAWQSERVASEVVPQWMPTAAKADGSRVAASAATRVMEGKEKYILDERRVVRLRGDEWYG